MFKFRFNLIVPRTLKRRAATSFMENTFDNEKKTNLSQEGTLKPDRPPSRPENAPARQRRGFAAMDRNLVREIARKGGKAAHAAGTAHEFTGEEARAAGRKGGRASHANRQKTLGEQQPVEARK
jgi:general stress protein YciG